LIYELNIIYLYQDILSKVRMELTIFLYPQAITDLTASFYCSSYESVIVVILIHIFALKNLSGSRDQISRFQGR